MKRRNAIRIISFLSAAVLVLCGFAFKSQKKIKGYELQIKNTYSKNLEEFGAAINNISVTLNKARYATTQQQISGLAARLLAEAEFSKTALSQLPSGNELGALNRFLSQVGNYAMSISGEMSDSADVGDTQRENIKKLSNIANKIAALVDDTQITYNNGDYWATELDKKVDETVESDGISAALGLIENEFSDYPTLVYDGPYSDHILEKEPAMLKGKAEISESEALKVAATTAECDEKDLKFEGFISGSIQSFSFAGNGAYVTVSKNGGYAVYMRKEREIGNAVLSYDQAREKAKRYLERTNMTSFTETYYFCNEGVCVVNFAFLDGETICYTDLVKVGVAMDNGEIVFYEASGYLSNHTERAFETPLYTKEQAQELVSGDLIIKSTAIALIPTKGKNEARCYEFACASHDGQEILVYINVMTLKEEQIFILLKSDGGTLVK